MCKCNKRDTIFQIPRIGSEDQFEENAKLQVCNAGQGKGTDN